MNKLHCKFNFLVVLPTVVDTELFYFSFSSSTQQATTRHNRARRWWSIFEGGRRNTALVIADTVWTLRCIWAFATACRCLIWAASRWIVSPSVNGPLLYTVSKLFRRACGAISNISITPAVARNGAWPSRSFNPLWTKFFFCRFSGHNLR